MVPVRFLAALAGLVLLTGCVAPVGPVEVNRFYVPDARPDAVGTILIEPEPGMDRDSLEFRTYAQAVRRELQRIGYAPVSERETRGQFVALVGFDRETVQPVRDRNPVSVGVGGGAGSYGSGVGVGVGIDLSGPPPAQVLTRLRVAIRDRVSARTVWEGRANFAVSGKSPMADTALGASRLAEALFGGFPGQSGETIYVR